MPAADPPIRQPCQHRKAQKDHQIREQCRPNVPRPACHANHTLIWELAMAENAITTSAVSVAAAIRLRSSRKPYGKTCAGLMRLAGPEICRTVSRGVSSNGGQNATC